MAAISKFDSSVIESISKLLGDTNGGFTGSQIAKLLTKSRIEDIDYRRGGVCNPAPNVFAMPKAKWPRLTSAKRFGRGNMPRPACLSSSCDKNK